MVTYKIKTFALNTFRCGAYIDDNIIAYTLYYIQNDLAYGKTFWHLNTELDPSIIKGMIDEILNHIRQLNIPALHTYPIKNKAILSVFANYFEDAIFLKYKTELDIADIKLLDYSISSFLCTTGIQDLADKDRISVIIPSSLGGD